jgi:hypothetical protein
MALRAIGQIVHRNTRLRMRFRDRVWLVIVTTIARIFNVAIGVTKFAVLLSEIAVVERECVDSQPCRRPAIYRMAALALQAEKAGVNSWLLMALQALFGCTAKALLGMAGRALSFGMASFQRENHGMLKVVHAVSTIVAIRAAHAKLFLVLANEAGSFFALRMAFHASLHIKFILQRTPVAVFADQRLLIVIQLMSG